MASDLKQFCVDKNISKATIVGKFKSKVKHIKTVITYQLCLSEFGGVYDFSFNKYFVLDSMSQHWHVMKLTIALDILYPIECFLRCSY